MYIYTVGKQPKISSHFKVKKDNNDKRKVLIIGVQSNGDDHRD